MDSHIHRSCLMAPVFYYSLILNVCYYTCDFNASEMSSWSRRDERWTGSMQGPLLLFQFSLQRPLKAGSGATCLLQPKSVTFQISNFWGKRTCVLTGIEYSMYSIALQPRRNALQYKNYCFNLNPLPGGPRPNQT
jgi:hypothetical protein